MRSINLLLAFLLASAAPAIAQEPFVVLEYRSGNSAAGGASIAPGTARRNSGDDRGKILWAQRRWAADV